MRQLIAFTTLFFPSFVYEISYILGSIIYLEITKNTKLSAEKMVYWPHILKFLI